MFWCDQRLQLTIDGPGTSRSLVIPRPFARIGSDESADLVLPREATGGRSWYLHATGKGVYCVELGKSVKSTRRRGRWVTPTQELELGTHSLYVKTVSGNGAPSGSEGERIGEEADPAEKPVVQFVSGTQSPRRRQLGRLTIVGNDRPSHLRIDDAELEAAHCVLYWSVDCLWVVDLLSAAGTWRDGMRYEVTSISRGESIQIGQTSLTLLGAMTRSESRGSGQVLEDPDEGADANHGMRSQELVTREVQVKREERLLGKLRSREERLQARQQQRAANWNAQRAEEGRALESRAQELDAREADLQQREEQLVRRQQVEAELPVTSDVEPPPASNRGETPADPPPALPVNELQAWRLQRMDPPPTPMLEGKGGDGEQVSTAGDAPAVAVADPAYVLSPRQRIVRAVLPATVCGLLSLATWPLLVRHAEILWYRAEFQLFPLVIAIATFLFWLRRPRQESMAVALRSRLETPLALGTSLLLIAAVSLPSSELTVAAVLCVAGVLLLHSGGRAVVSHWAIPWGLLWLVIPLPQGWDMRCQMGFETLVGRTAAECLRIWAGAVVAPPGHALLEAACSGWTAPITAIAVGVFLVARKPRHWLTRTLLLAAVIPFALLLSVLVVVMDRRGYLVSDGNGAVLLLVSAVLLTLDVLTGLLLRHRINRDQSKSVPVRTKGDTRTLCNRRSAWHWWLTVPVVLALAVFQSVLWWNPDLVLSRDPARKRAVFPHAAWEQGSLPNLQRGGQAIEVGPVEVVSGGFSSLQTYRWQIEGPQLKMWLSIDLPLTNWQSPAPAAVGWFDAPELRWLKLEMLEAGGPAVAYRSPAGGDHFYLWVMVFNERGVALPVPAVGLDSWQSELAQLVDRSLLARVVGWPEATCRLRLEFTSQRQLTTDELRRVALEFQQVARWLERTFQEQPASGRRGAE